MPETTPALTDWWDPWDVYQALVRVVWKESDRSGSSPYRQAERRASFHAGNMGFSNRKHNVAFVITQPVWYKDFEGWLLRYRGMGDAGGSTDCAGVLI